MAKWDEEISNGSILSERSNNKITCIEQINDK